MYIPRIVQYVIWHVLCNSEGIQEWGKCLHLLIRWGGGEVMEYRASENVTPKPVSNSGVPTRIVEGVVGL